MTHDFLNYFLQRAPWVPKPAGVWVWKPLASSHVSLWESQCRLGSKPWTVWSPLVVDSVSSSLETDRPGERTVLKVNTWTQDGFWFSSLCHWSTFTVTTFCETASSVLSLKICVAAKPLLPSTPSSTRSVSMRELMRRRSCTVSTLPLARRDPQ